MLSYLSPLRNRNFRGLFIAQMVSLLGTGLTTIALALLAYHIEAAGAGKLLGTILAIKMVAYLTIAPLFASISDHLPRRLTLALLNIPRALCLIMLPFVTGFWQLMLIMFFINACAACFTPMFQSIIPDIVTDDDDYTNAVALTRLLSELEILISPLLAATLLMVVHYDWLFYVNSVAFMAAALIIIRLPLPGMIKQAGGGQWRKNLVSGFRVFLLTPRLKGLLALHVVASLGGAMVMVNSISLVRQLLGESQVSLALSMAVFGAGAIVAALLTPRFLRHYSDRSLMLGGGLLMTLAMLAGCGLQSWSYLLMVWFFTGLGYSAILTPSARLIRLSSQPQDRHKLFATNFTLSHLCWFFSYWIAGWVFTPLGVEKSFLVFAGVSALALWLAMRYWPQSDAHELLHTHLAEDHQHAHYHDEHHQHSHSGDEGPEPHSHPHYHAALSHTHAYVIDDHHPRWPG